METQHENQVAELIESMKNLNFFTKLKPENKRKNSFMIPIKVSCYNELNMMVSDLLKASIILLNNDAKSLSPFTADSDVSVLTLLEIALQLLPGEEMQLLDDLHTIHLQSDVKLNNV